MARGLHHLHSIASAAALHRVSAHWAGTCCELVQPSRPPPSPVRKDISGGGHLRQEKWVQQDGRNKKRKQASISDIKSRINSKAKSAYWLYFHLSLNAVKIILTFFVIYWRCLFIYSSPHGPDSNLQPPAQMTAASSISVTSEEFDFIYMHNLKSRQNNGNGRRLESLLHLTVLRSKTMLGWMPVRLNVFDAPWSHLSLITFSAPRIFWFSTLNLGAKLSSQISPNCLWT